MVDRVQAEDLLKAYGKATGIGAIAFDDEGHCRLEFDGRLLLDISFDERTEALRLVAPLGEARLDERSGLAAEMLDANALWRGTGGATLGVQRETRLAFLSFAIPMQGLEAGAFERRIDGFVAVAMNWADRIAGRDDAQSVPATERRIDPTLVRA
jgi:hypothetical protein